MKKIIIVALILLLFSCSEKSSQQNDDRKIEKCNSSIWLPQTGLNDSLAVGINNNSKFILGIPKEYKVTSSAEITYLSKHGNFIPRPNGLKVTGGKYITFVDTIQKYADFGSWTYVYKNSSKDDIITYGFCIVEGELLLPNYYFKTPSKNLYIENYFEAIDFGKYFIKVRLDSTKGHKLCILPGADYYYPTTNFIGTKIETQNKIIERKPGGWYCDTIKVAD